ncbi:MAG: metallophosphoesterase [Cellulophaga sp.]
MKNRLLKYLKRILLVSLLGLSLLFIIGYYLGAEYHSGDNPLAANWDNEGPYIFYENDSVLNVRYIMGNEKEGLYEREKKYHVDSLISVRSHYPLDSSSFDFSIKSNNKTPKSTYRDNGDILAISDVEGSYKAFRDFLIHSKVIDEDLNWTFGNGHLVLVGDFVDRGAFVTQVLWFIYKLEQEAEKEGGFVHFIIGNHEIKNMHGNYRAAGEKYEQFANTLGKEQLDLYGVNSVIGNWMSNKNAIELINGNLFVHGGIHPDLANFKLNLSEINEIIRADYYHFPTSNKSNSSEKSRDEIVQEFLVSSKTGPCWYRGYFKDNLSQEEVESGLAIFNANTVIVGHTIQNKVNRQYQGKVIGIDVQHPQGHRWHWPQRKSEALHIEGSKYYRVFANGDKEEI